VIWFVFLVCSRPWVQLPTLPGNLEVGFPGCLGNLTRLPKKMKESKNILITDLNRPKMRKIENSSVIFSVLERLLFY
jgi:hypothetical protein